MAHRTSSGLGHISPTRKEDFMAVAEENSRLRNELERLKVDRRALRKARVERFYVTMERVAKWAVLTSMAICAAVAVIYPIRSVYRQKQCWYISNDYDNRVAPNPWQWWACHKEPGQDPCFRREEWDSYQKVQDALRTKGEETCR